MAAPVMYIQCGLQYPGGPSAVAVLVSRAVIAAVNGTTGETDGPCWRRRTLATPASLKHASCSSPGKTLWSTPLKDIESQAVLLPDLEGDSVPDLLVATLPADKVT